MDDANRDRMPVLLGAGDIDAWLSGKIGRDGLEPGTATDLRQWPVRRLLNQTGVGDDNPTRIEQDLLPRRAAMVSDNDLPHDFDGARLLPANDDIDPHWLESARRLLNAIAAVVREEGGGWVELRDYITGSEARLDRFFRLTGKFERKTIIAVADNATRWIDSRRGFQLS